MRMDEVFGEGGSLSRTFPGYARREGQARMASLCSRCFSEDRWLICEAGTGIGKSFAYLIPALAWAGQAKTKLTDHAENRVVIATATRFLETQLYDRDVKFLREKLGYAHVDVSLLCGRSNYLCLRRFLDYLSARPKNVHLQNMEKAAKESAFSGLRFRFPFSITETVWKEVEAESELCDSSFCPYIADCFFYRAKAEAKKADVIITNQSLLLSDMKIKAGQKREKGRRKGGSDLVLPPFSRLIIDEAHELAEAAPRFYADSFIPSLLERELFSLIRKKDRFPSPMETALRFSTSGDFGPNTVRAVEKTAFDLEDLDEILSAAVDTAEGEIAVEEEKRLPPEVWEMLRHAREELSSLSDELNALASADSGSEKSAGAVDAILRAAGKLDSASSVIERLARVKGDEETLRSVGRERGRAAVTLTPFDVSSDLCRDLFTGLRTLILTSASLSVGEKHDFSFFRRKIGLGEETHPWLEESPAFFASPFDYGKQMLLLVPDKEGSEPLYRAEKREEWRSYIARSLPPLLAASDGGSLVLFASWSDLEDALADTTVEEDGKRYLRGTRLEVLYQGEYPRAALADLFSAGRDTILYGTMTFWVGFDAKGDTLRLLVIPRIPFRNVSDPYMRRCDFLYRRREEEIRGDGTMRPADKRKILWDAAPLNNEQVPRAALLLRQGRGRLIRDASDSGVAAILDRRIMKYSYGARLRGAFPVKETPLPVSAFPAKTKEFLQR